jgi:hypothetical protein
MVDMGQENDKLENSSQMLQLKAFRGKICGRKGIMIPYVHLFEALHLPKDSVMINLIDFGHEIEIELYDKAAIKAEDGIFCVVPNCFSSKFITKDAFLELLFWFYVDDFSAQFFIRKPGCPLQGIEGDPIVIQRYSDWVFVWLEDTTGDYLEFVSEYAGDKK